jgi:DnaK suppressor protein
MALNKETVETIRAQLIRRKDSLSAEVTQATQGFIEDDHSYSDSIDQAAADTDKTVAVQVSNREREGIREIEEALRRLDAGSFGICNDCGDEISEARMKAYPETTLCIVCKAEQESEKNRYGGRSYSTAY